MKTRGIEISDGYLVLPWGRACHEQFWNRLKHGIARAALIDEFKADKERERSAFEADAFAGEWSRINVAVEHEERLFRRWAVRVFGPQELWPWTRGWSEEAVDAYLENVGGVVRGVQGAARGQAA